MDVETEIIVKFSFKARGIKGKTIPGAMNSIAKVLKDHGYRLSDYSAPRIVGKKTLTESES